MNYFDKHQDSVPLRAVKKAERKKGNWKPKYLFLI